MRRLPPIAPLGGQHFGAERPQKRAETGNCPHCPRLPPLGGALHARHPWPGVAPGRGGQRGAMGAIGRVLPFPWGFAAPPLTPWGGNRGAIQATFLYLPPA